MSKTFRLSVSAMRLGAAESLRISAAHEAIRRTFGLARKGVSSGFSSAFRAVLSRPLVDGVIQRGRVKACGFRRAGAIVAASDPLVGCRFSSLRRLGEQGPRRLAVVSVGFVENDGRSGRRFSLLMGAPCGKPSGLPRPNPRSANPHGVARPFSSECVTSPETLVRSARSMCADSSRPAVDPAGTLSPVSADKVFHYLFSDDNGLRKAESEAVSPAVRSVVTEGLSALQALEKGRPATMPLRLSDVEPMRAALLGLRALIAVRDRASIRAHLFA